jgi:hypothetical protein
MAVCGTRSAYMAGCRCDACRAAHRNYNREWLRKEARIRYGIEERINRLVDATEAREHILWLGTKGIGRRVVAQHAKLTPSTIVKIRNGQIRNVHPETAARILAVNLSHLPPRATVDGTRTAEQIDQILAAGLSKAALARAITGNPNTRRLQVHPERVTIATKTRVDAIWQKVFAADIARRQQEADRRRAHRRAQRDARHVNQ